MVTNVISCYNLSSREHVDIKYKEPQDGALGILSFDFCPLQLRAPWSSGKIQTRQEPNTPTQFLCYKT